MGKYVASDRKIGEHLLSILFMDLSVWSLRKSVSHIVVSKNKGVEGRFFDEKKGRWRLFRYEKIVLLNAGNVPVTVKGLHPVQSQRFSGLIASILKDIKAQEVKSEVLLVEEFFEDLKYNDSILSSYQGWSLEKLGGLHRIIPAGGTTTLNLVFLYDAYEGRKRVSDYIITKLEICFSNGTTCPYQVITETKNLTKPSNNMFTKVLQI